MPFALHPQHFAASRDEIHETSRLEATDPARITDVYVKFELQQDGSAWLDLQITLHNNSYQTPEAPLFYRLCDEAGITVWQDFSLSHPIYPKTNETKQKIFDECIEVVKHLRNNPSVIS